MSEQSERRLAENEVIFRQANEDAKDFVKDIGAAGHVLVPFFCECSDQDCRGRINMSVATYEQVHRSKKRFIVLPGHEMPKIETVVERADGYNVVEKTAPLPGDKDIDTALRHLTL